MARIEPPDPNTIQTRELILHWRKIGGRAEITPQFAHDLDAQTFTREIGYMGERIVLQMQSRILADKIDHEDVTVPFTKTVKSPARVATVTLARSTIVPLIVIALFAIVALASVTNMIALVALPPLALCSVVAWRSLAPVDLDVTQGEVVVSGEVTVPADYWMTFPKNTIVYPKELGDAVRMIEYGSPDVRFFDPERGNDA